MIRSFTVALIFLLFLAYTPVSAAFVTVQQNGEVIMNVLPAQDDIESAKQPDSLKVTNVANTDTPSQTAEIAIKNQSGKVELTVNDGSNTQLADVTGITDEIIEIEQQDAPSKISVLASGEGFILKEKNISAFTSFPITIDPAQKRISLQTSSGAQFLSILPAEALGQVVQSRIIDVIDGDHLTLTNGELGEVQYSIQGKRTLNILNVFEYEVPVAASVSATNGKVIAIDQPIWLPIASLLFT